MSDFETAIKNANAAQSAEFIAAMKQEIGTLRAENQQNKIALESLHHESMVQIGQLSAVINTLSISVAGSTRPAKKSAAEAGASATSSSAAPTGTAPAEKFASNSMFWFNQQVKNPEYWQNFLRKMNEAHPGNTFSVDMEAENSGKDAKARPAADATFMWKQLKNTTTAEGKKLRESIQDEFKAAKEAYENKQKVGAVEQKIEVSTPT